MKSEEQKLKEKYCRCGKLRDGKYSLCKECHNESCRESYKNRDRDILTDNFNF